MNFKELQKWKAEEFESFFQSSDDYYLYLNHLGEVKWMTEDEAEEQHEFYMYDESPLQSIRKRMQPKRSIAYDKLPEEEREYRLQIRKYLEERYSGAVQGNSAAHMPHYFKTELTSEDIDHIPLTLDIIQANKFSKSLLFLLAFIVAAIAFGAYLAFSSPPVKTGVIKVDANMETARVFLDGQQYGYTGQEIGNLPVGGYVVSVRKPGYRAIPSSQLVVIGTDSVSRLSFELKEVVRGKRGNLVISAPFSDSKIFVNDDFVGVLSEMDILTLQEGEHIVLLEKAGYASSPSEQIVDIRAGDTVMISFEQQFTTAARPVLRNTRSQSNLGSLEVSTNMSGAKILLNGRDTGKEAGYIFSDLPFGEYRVRVQKEGFESTPEEQQIVLSDQVTSAEVVFKLMSVYQQLKVSATPDHAPILVDGEVRGQGSLALKLDPGKYTLSFGEIEGYKTPKSRTITIGENKPQDINVSYFPVVRISASVAADGNLTKQNCDVAAGYTFKNRGFASSNEAGPEIVFNEKLGEYVWKCGYAFPFRNPKGNDALKFSFNLPQNTNSTQKFTLLLEAIATEEKYPLSFTGKSDVRVKYNGHILSYNYSPKTVEDLSGLETIRWDVSGFAKPGLNTVEITTTDDNNRFYLIKSVRVVN